MCLSRACCVCSSHRMFRNAVCVIESLSCSLSVTREFARCVTLTAGLRVFTKNFRFDPQSMPFLCSHSFPAYPRETRVRFPCMFVRTRATLLHAWFHHCRVGALTHKSWYAFAPCWVLHRVQLFRFRPCHFHVLCMLKSCPVFIYLSVF